MFSLKITTDKLINKILSYYVKYQNQLIFNKIEDYLPFIETFNEDLIIKSKNKPDNILNKSKIANYGFIHCFAYYSKNPLNLKLLKTILNEQNINLQNVVGYTPLILASRYSNTTSTEETVKMLLEHPNINVNLQNVDGNTALMLASRYCNTDSTEKTVKMLLEHPNINVNLQNVDGNTALMLISGANLNTTERTVKKMLLNYFYNYFTKN